MNVREFLMQVAIETILKQCNYNLKWVKALFKRVCGEDCDYRYYIKKFKEYLQSKYNRPDTEEKKELITLLQKEFGNESKD